jgi:rod shape-determining protein MreD
MPWKRLLSYLPSLKPAQLNLVVIVGSVLICLIGMMAKIPGTQLAGVGTHWLLIWVVSWSIRRSPLEGAVAGISLGLLQDALTDSPVSHVLSLAIVGALTARLQKRRYIQEDFISIALIVFGMAILSETIFALQMSLAAAPPSWLQKPNLSPSIGTFSLDSTASEGDAPSVGLTQLIASSVGYTAAEIWPYHQRVALSSAVVSSLWAPLVSYPINRWWDALETSEQGVNNVN